MESGLTVDAWSKLALETEVMVGRAADSVLLMSTLMLLEF
jgi:hypothetical protein